MILCSYTGEWENYLKVDSVFSIYVDENDHWFATNSGVVLKNNSEKHHYTSKDGLSESGYKEILKTGDGRILAIGMQGSISQFNSKKDGFHSLSEGYRLQNLGSPVKAMVQGNYLILLFETRLCFFELSSSTSILSIDIQGENSFGIDEPVDIEIVGSKLYLGKKASIRSIPLNFQSLLESLNENNQLINPSDPSEWQELVIDTSFTEDVMEIQQNSTGTSVNYFSSKGFRDSVSQTYSIRGDSSIVMEGNSLDVAQWFDDSVNVASVVKHNNQGWYIYTPSKVYHYVNQSMSSVGDLGTIPDSVNVVHMSVRKDQSVITHDSSQVFLQSANSWKKVYTGNTILASFAFSTDEIRVLVSDTLFTLEASGVFGVREKIPLTCPDGLVYLGHIKENGALLFSSVSSGVHYISVYSEGMHCNVLNTGIDTSAIIHLADGVFGGNDSEVFLAVASDGHLKIFPSNSAFTQFGAPVIDRKVNQFSKPNSISRDYEGAFWITVNDGFGFLCEKLTEAQSGSEVELEDLYDKECLDNNTITRVDQKLEYPKYLFRTSFTDSAQYVWLSAVSEGLFKIDATAKIFETNKSERFLPNNSGLGNATILNSIYDSESGKIWLQHTNGYSVYHSSSRSAGGIGATNNSFSAYPNPFYPLKHGVMAIDNIRNNSEVTIRNEQGVVLKMFSPEQTRDGFIQWNGKNQDDKLVKPGIYFIVIRNGKKYQKRKVIVLH